MQINRGQQHILQVCLFHSATHIITVFSLQLLTMIAHHFVYTYLLTVLGRLISFILTISHLLD